MQSCENALMAAISASIGAPAFKILAPPRYNRALNFCGNPDGSASCTIAKWGWEYKHRGPRPKTPPQADIGAISTILAAALPPNLCIAEIHDYGTHVKLEVRISP